MRRVVAGNIAQPVTAFSPQPTRKKHFRVLDVVSYDQGKVRLRSLLVLLFGFTFLTAQWFLYSLLGVAVEDADAMDIADNTIWTMVARTNAHNDFSSLTIPTTAILTAASSNQVPLTQQNVQGSLPDPRVLLPGLSMSLGVSYSIYYWTGDVPLSLSSVLDSFVTLELSYTLGGDDRIAPTLQSWHRDYRPNVITLVHENSNTTQVDVTYFRSVPAVHIRRDYDAGTISVDLVDSIKVSVYAKGLNLTASDGTEMRALVINDITTTTTNVPFTSANAQFSQSVTVSIHDISEPLVTIAAQQSWTFAYAGLLLAPIIFGLLLSYCYLRIWVLMRNVRENNGQPPLFYEGMLEYRGW